MRLLILGTAAVAAFAFVTVGCQSSKPAVAKPVHYYYQDADAASAAQKGQAFEDPSKVTEAKGATKAELVKFTKVQQTAKVAMDKNPTDATKSKYVELTVDLANKTMYSPELTNHEKYAGALRLFRAALKVDPNNKVAKSWADNIVAIYASMHRPVPE